MLSRLFQRALSLSEKDSAPICEFEPSKRPSTVPNPDSDISDIACFTDVLPDSHKYLFRKLLQQEAATTFHRFQELDEKIRLKIWAMTLPGGRDIRLRVQYRLGHYDKSEFGFPAPATFYVNKESRAVTMKYFYFFEQNLAFVKLPSLPERPVCYCINPTTDRITISFQSLFNAHFTLFLKTMFNYIPYCMDAIRVLEIVDVYQSGYAHQESNYQEVRQFLLDNVARFHHLDEIRFILNDREELDPDVARAWKVKIVKAYARKKRDDPDCKKFPNIIFVSWKVREAMRLLNIEHRV